MWARRLCRTVLTSDHDMIGVPLYFVWGFRCDPDLFMHHCDQIRFPGIPVRRCRFSGIGVDGNAFHRFKTSHKRSYLLHLSSKQSFKIVTYWLKRYRSAVSSPNLNIHSSIQFCCLSTWSYSGEHIFSYISTT